MYPVTVRGLSIGPGKPKIILPLVGATRSDLRREAEVIRTLPADLAEWRVDCFHHWQDPEARAAACSLLRDLLGELPLLITFRTASEGGQGELSRPAYAALLRDLAGQADLLDIEVCSGDDLIRELVAFCQERGVKTILSSHDFQKTPPQEALVARLARMEALGGDLLKVAVMPQTPEDVLTLLAATQEARQKLHQPIITMSMGPLGAVSRISGELFGSSLTFGAGEQASAPGQIPARDLARMLETLRLG